MVSMHSEHEPETLIFVAVESKVNVHISLVNKATI